MKDELKLLIATHNLGKLREYQEIFADWPLRLVSLDDVGIAWEVAETGQTFEENARLKAGAYYNAARLPTLADDSGLEVAALGGEPGVYSARYAGPHATQQARIEFLLHRMAHVPAGQRQARFRCVIALALSADHMQVVEGLCEGEIAFAPRGAGGFGYDSLFYFPQFGRTLAELSAEEKNGISHRGRAAKEAKRNLRGC